jgi:hypothetical protein
MSDIVAIPNSNSDPDGVYMDKNVDCAGSRSFFSRPGSKSLIGALIGLHIYSRSHSPVLLVVIIFASIVGVVLLVKSFKKQG